MINKHRLTTLFRCNIMPAVSWRCQLQGKQYHNWVCESFVTKMTLVSHRKIQCIFPASNMSTGNLMGTIWFTWSARPIVVPSTTTTQIGSTTTRWETLDHCLSFRQLRWTRTLVKDNHGWYNSLAPVRVYWGGSYESSCNLSKIIASGQCGSFLSL